MILFFRVPYHTLSKVLHQNLTVVIIEAPILGKALSNREYHHAQSGADGQNLPLSLMAILP